MKPLIVIICLIFFLAGCDKGSQVDCILPPDPFNFRIIDRSTRKDLVSPMTPVYYRDSMRLFYIQDGKPVDLSIHAARSSHQYDILSNVILPYLSALQGIKDYFLQLNYLEIDTLLIDVRELRLSDCTFFEHGDCYINGGIMNKAMDDRSVFLVE